MEESPTRIGVRERRISSAQNGTPANAQAESGTTIFDLYGRYFQAVGWLGILPFKYERGGKDGTYRVRILGVSLKRLLWCLNYAYLILYLVKQHALLGFAYRTRYKYETMKNSYMFLGLWIFGYLLISSLFFTQALQMRAMARTICMWLGLEHHLAETITRNQPRSEAVKRHKFLKIQFGLSAATLASSILTLTGMAFGIPKFPPFLSSLIIGHENKGERLLPAYGNTPGAPFGLLSAKLGMSVVEAYTGCIAWAILGSFDVLMSMMCRTVCHALDKLRERVERKGVQEAEDELGLYHSLRIFVTVLNGVFGRLLFVQEMFNMGTTVLLLYGALKTNYSVVLSAFFVTNGVAVTLRIYLLYLPMSNVYTKSLRFGTFLKRKLVEAKLAQRAEQGAGLGTRELGTTSQRAAGREYKRVELDKRVAGFRFMVFRPWGFHRISTTSIVDYIFAAFSYLVTIKNV